MSKRWYQDNRRDAWREESGEGGLVIGVDLLATSPVEGATIIIGDITDESTIERIGEALEDREINVVVSDISPNLTGRYDTDQTISLELSTLVLDAAMRFVPPGGSFVTKIFQGVGIEGLVDAAKDRFSNVQRFSPTASRSSSSETYLVCQNRLQRVRTAARDKTALEQVNQHLSRLGILVEESDEEEETVVGFRRLNKDSD